VFASTLKQHLERLEEAFSRFRLYNLKLNASKCHVLKPSPENIKQLRSFLGLCNFNRKIIKNYTPHCAPLYKLLSKELSWTEEATEIFERLKLLLTSPPMLHYPDFKKIFKVSTDASDKVIGAVLSQDNEEGEEKVIQIITTTLQPAEQKWSVREKEALAIIFACETFPPYLYGSKFFIYTDHCNG
jgi:hypothetical protein